MIRNGEKVRGKLKSLVIENIGLVDMGANQMADMVISKRAPVLKYGDTITSDSAQQITLVLRNPAHG